jgi:hypothetical protein
MVHSADKAGTAQMSILAGHHNPGISKIFHAQTVEAPPAIISLSGTIIT